MSTTARRPAPTEALKTLLQELPDEVSRPLGPLASALLAPLRPTGQLPAAGPVEPEGIDGVRQRGPWERLRHSEWALLDAHAEAFLQRAVDGELQFLHLARTGPQPPQALVVLLDSGPAALGAPRLVQAAVLLALGAQAAALGIPLQWGALGGVPKDRREGLGPDWLSTFRALRQLQSAPLPRAAPELHLPPQAWALVVHSRRGVAALPGARSLRVLHENNQLQTILDGRPLPLPLPGTAEALAVLRAPAPRRAPANPRGDLPAKHYSPWLLFSASGARLLVHADRAEQVLAVPVPGLSGGRVHTHELPRGGRLGGAGWVRQRIAVLSQRPGKLWTVRRDVRVAQIAVPELMRALDALEAPLLLVNPTDGSSRTGVMLLPAPPVTLEHRIGHGLRAESILAGVVVRWEGPPQQPEPARAAVMSLSGRLLALADNNPTQAWLEGGPERLALPRPCTLVPWGSRALVFSVDGASIHTATEDTRRRFGDRSSRPVSAQGQLIGVVRSGGRRTVRLVVLKGRQLYLAGPRGTRPLAAAEDVLAAATSPQGQLAAWVDGTGRLTLWSAVDHRILQQSGAP